MGDIFREDKGALSMQNPWGGSCFTFRQAKEWGLPREAPLDRKSRFLSHFPTGLEHCESTETAVICPSVIIGLVRSLELTDGQGGRAARLGARELVKDP